MHARRFIRSPRVRLDFGATFVKSCSHLASRAKADKTDDIARAIGETDDDGFCDGIDKDRTATWGCRASSRRHQALGKQ
jgi:ubiquinone biosynthesis protein UbiJ